jgi:hypothetical protein
LENLVDNFLSEAEDGDFASDDIPVGHLVDEPRRVGGGGLGIAFRKVRLAVVIPPEHGVLPKLGELFDRLGSENAAKESRVCELSYGS